MPNFKSPTHSKVVSRRLVMPDEINPNGTLFGGILMGWIDMAAFMCAQRHAGTSNVVTASVDRLDFLAPLRIGDHVVVTATLEYVGRSSMSICVQIEREGNDPAASLVAMTYLTFVALDAQGKPMAVPSLRTATEVERLAYADAALRTRMLQKFRKWWVLRQQRAATSDGWLPVTSPN